MIDLGYFIKSLLFPLAFTKQTDIVSFLLTSQKDFILPFSTNSDLTFAHFTGVWNKLKNETVV